MTKTLLLFIILLTNILATFILIISVFSLLVDNFKIFSIFVVISIFLYALNIILSYYYNFTNPNDKIKTLI